MSVFEALTFFDPHRRPLEAAEPHRFLVVWDEDHDERILEVAEHMHVRGTLASVAILAERKAAVKIVLVPDCDATPAPANLTTKDGDTFVVTTFDRLTDRVARALVDDPRVDLSLSVLRNLCTLFGVA